MTPENCTVGVIGFGIMGASMARNIAKGGCRVLGASRSPEKVTALAPEGIVPSSLAEIAAQCRVVLLSVTNGASVEDVLFGPEGIARTIAPGSLIIDTTTIAPDEARALCERCEARGLKMVDAPVTGGDVGARNGTLTIMCGGSSDSFKEALPILQLIGKRILHIGGPGMGQAMKAVNQVGIGLGIVAMTESLLLAESQGIDSAVALEILQSGSAGSWAFSNYAPRLLAGDLQPGFGAVHMLKDLKIALAIAKSEGRALPGLETTTTLFEQLIEARQGVGNHALIEAYRR